VEVDATHRTSAVKSVAYKRNLSVITVSPDQRHGQYVFWEGLFNVLTKHGLSLPLMATSEYRVSFVVDERAVTDGLLHELRQFGTVTVLRGKGCISVVGEGIKDNAAITSAIFKALDDADICMVSFGASESSLSLVLDADQIPGALKRLHREFFERAAVGEAFTPSGG
jgi:aspartate kinase